MSATTEEPPQARIREAPRWMRAIIVGGAFLAVLLLGGAAGLVLGARADGGLPIPGPTSVDVGFSQDMSVHHRQGVLLAAIAREHSTDPQIRLLAYDIEATQMEQIGRMQGWLSLWDASSQPRGPHMRWMTGHGAHGQGLAVMPGMASKAEIDRLRASSGHELDVLFCQLMLRHHQGGVPMMREAQQRADLPQVRNLARQMNLSQGKEIQYLTTLLAERGAAPLPPPRFP